MALNSAQLIATGQLDGFRNRIINGRMEIDQRNAGAAVTLSAASQYTLDRYTGVELTDGTATVQRSTVAPSGFTNSLVFTVGTADSSLSSTQYANTSQSIEGLNVADLDWGTANAQPATLSFWVRGSVTGTYAISARNEALDRSYVATYSISAANTWEKKIITIPGDTTGTWLKDIGRGIVISFQVAAGSSYHTTAGAWTAGNFFSTSSAVNMMATAGATWYLTGVQLEKGPVATDFDFRSYQQEFALCQRYYCNSYSTDIAPGSVTSVGVVTTIANAGGSAQVNFVHPVEMRANPTYTLFNFATGALGTWRDGTGADRAVAASSVGTRQGIVSSVTTGASAALSGHVVASIEL